MVVDAMYAGALLLRAQGQTIRVFTNDRTALTTPRTSVRKSGQAIVGKIPNHMRCLKESSNRMIFTWSLVNRTFEITLVQPKACLLRPY
jgi:hypothetical protein